MGTLAPVPRICGREAEIQALGEALDRVAAGGPVIVLAEGEAGIGKTRLLAEVLADARGRGMRVVAGRAEELERTRPFGVLATAFGCTRSSPDPRRAAIAGLLGSQGAGEQGPITVTSDPGLRFRVVDAFTDLAEELALSGPVVLGLDDLQWADPSSLLTVGVLARRLSDLPVGVVRLADDSPGRLGHRYPIHRFRGDILTALGRLDEARSTLETGMRISEELGIPWGFALYQLARALERFLAGHWDDAVAEIETDTGLAGVPGGSYNLLLRRGVLSLIRLHRNDLPGARDAVGAAPDELPGTVAGYRADWSAWAQALLLEASGELVQALETLSDCWDRCARSGLALEYPVIGPDLVRMALAAEDVGRARDVAAAVTGVASRNEVPWITGAALRCQGLAENDAGILQAAVDACARGARPLELALACEEAGSAYARRGNVDRAGQLLDHAITIYEDLDAARDLARAEAGLRQIGVRRGRHVEHRRAQSGWASLTPSERAVVDLVAEGLSNPQIGQRLYVSRRTVQTHLGHVFAKLHVTSRTQLAAEAIRHRG